MHKGKDGLVMEVREIYKISDMIHKAAGWKKENVFLVGGGVDFLFKKKKKKKKFFFFKKKKIKLFFFLFKL